MFPLPLSDGDHPTLAALIERGFEFPPQESARLVRRLGADVFRLGRVPGGPVVAAAAAIPFSQAYAGRFLPVTGLALVTIDPAWQGQGLGRRWVKALLRQARQGGRLLALLYTATLPLYTGLGAARAGSALRYRAPIAATGPGRAAVAPGAPGAAGTHGRALRQLEPLRQPEHRNLLDRLRRQLAAQGASVIERPDGLWSPVLEPEPGGVAPAVVLIDGPAGPEGYAVLAPVAEGRLELLDHGLVGGAAGRCLLELAAGSAEQAEWLVWRGGPEDPLAQLLPQSGIEIDDWDQWLARVLDVEGVLRQRGWPAGLETGLTLEVEDPLFAANRGRFALTVQQGRAAVARLAAGEAGAPRLRCSIDGLAPLVTGHLSPACLVQAGLIEGEADALARATLAFAGPRPWLADEF